MDSFMKEPWWGLLIFGFLGVASRFSVDWLILKTSLFGKETHPALGTLFVNILGCFIAGWIYAHSEMRGLFSSSLKTILISGFCGGFTTFSGFALHSLQMFFKGNYSLFLIYVTTTPLFSLLAAAFGVFLGRKI